MNYKLKLIIIMLICIVLVGCNNEKNVELSDLSYDDNLKEDIFNNQIDENDMGSFMFGPKVDKFETYIYKGEEIHIPFEVSGLSETVSDFGLMVFVGGDIQPFKILRKDGIYSDEAIMHEFSLSNNQVDNFDIVFIPIRGNKGDKVGIEFATIFKPDFIPVDIEKSNYYNYHDLISTVPQELYFDIGLPNNLLNVCREYNEEDIPDSILKQNARQNSIINKLDDKVVMQLLPDGTETDFNNNVFISKENKLKFKLRIMGGPNDIDYRTYIYINHEPVEIMGYDCFDVNVKKGKMCTVELELNTTGFDKLSTIYAISNPIDGDYMSSYCFATKTKSGLVVIE